MIMKKVSASARRFFAVFAIALTLLSITVIGFGGVGTRAVALAGEDFEAQIKDFPESYKVHLRQLHEKYPDWKFEMLETGLEWSDAIDAESSKNRSLVPKSASSFLKSKKPGDYDPETDTYIEKDVGWVTADRIAVLHFMDPRNFLTEANIFQFELLSFSDAITIETVEEVLKGTFMHDTEISYYDAQGSLVCLDEKYSQVIYDAGKTYNINPCYLASKIRNEVVVSGGGASDAVTGKYWGYEGIYNFFNIGANDGAEPIKNGLKWASYTVDTYGRPWTNPEKSIMGGAEYLAENYISKGQDTGYLQKFNVTPLSEYPIYTHQYMTNVSGADSQGYSTYLSYAELGLLSLERVFSIPVFRNMPGESSQTGALMFDGLSGQTATVNYSSGINIRSSASTLGTIVTRAPYGTKVTILDKTQVVSDRYNHFLNNPFWCHIKFNLNGKEYTGYASADYLTFNVSKNLNVGNSFKLMSNYIGSEKPAYRSSDESVAVVDADGIVTAKGCGTAEIFATTSDGGFDLLSLNVNHSFGKWIVRKQPTCVGAGKEERSCSGCGYTESRNISATGKHNQNTIIPAVEATYTSNGKTAGRKCSVCGKVTVAQKSTEKLSVKNVKVGGLKAKSIKVAKSSEIKLTWNKIGDGVKYEIQQYKNGKWKKIKTTSKTSYTVKKLKSNKSYKFRVRAVVDSIKGKYSTTLTVKTVPEKTTLTLKAGKKQLTASWKSVSSISGYEVQYSTSKAMKNAKTVKVKKSSKKTTIKKLKKGKKYYVRVRSYKTVNGKKIYSSWSKVKNVKVK